MAYNFVRLIKNHIYPTFQLYAQMANRKTDPKDGLKIGALTVLDWLKNRLGDNCPEEIRRLPLPEDYKLLREDDLRSFHQNCGYVIDIVSNLDDGEWSVQISEPDLGSDPGKEKQDRQTVPGRVIFTDISFKVVGPDLHCGFRTMISDPEGSEKARVYRLTVVRELALNPAFGLKQVSVLTEKAYRVETKEQVKNLVDIHCNSGNQLPIVVFVGREQKTAPAVPVRESKPKQEKPVPLFAGKKDVFDVASKSFQVEADLKMPSYGVGKDYFSGMETKLPPEALNRILNESTAQKYKVPVGKKVKFDPDEYAHYLIGRTLVYFLDASQIRRFNEISGLNIKEGNLLIWEPVCIGNKAVVVQPENINEDELEEKLQYIHDWSRDKDISYGPVTFLSSTRQHLLDNIEKAEIAAQNADIESRNRLNDLKSSLQEELRKKEEEIASLKKQVENLRVYAGGVEQEKTDLREQQAAELEKKNGELINKDRMIEFLNRKLDRPKDIADIPDWVSRHFAGKLLMHDKAVDLLKKSSHQNGDLICEALEFLAMEYRDQYFHEITEEEEQRLSSEKYGRLFEIKPNGKMTTDQFYKDYHVKYKKAGAKEERDVPLDVHLCYGVKNPNLVRIYFFVDEQRKLIVVGSLPGHLDTINC